MFLYNGRYSINHSEIRQYNPDETVVLCGVLYNVQQTEVAIKLPMSRAETSLNSLNSLKATIDVQLPSKTSETS